jgi:hypothetical protein
MLIFGSRIYPYTVMSAPQSAQNHFRALEFTWKVGWPQDTSAFPI